MNSNTLIQGTALHRGSDLVPALRTAHLQATDRPVEVIESLPRRPSQPPTMRQYRPGFEQYLNLLPVLDPSDRLLNIKTQISGEVVKALGQDLLQNAPWVRELPPDGQFHRHIVAVEEPLYEEQEQELASVVAAHWPSLGGAAQLTPPRKLVKEGAELLVAQWGKGFTSPIHGHAAGLLHEEILLGKIRVDLFRWHRDGVVRPLRTDIIGPGTLVSEYAPPDSRGDRMGVPHSFTAVEPTASLHYVPEHTRDGRDNRFKVEYFDEVFPLRNEDVTQITAEEGRKLRVGDVALVRSENVPEYGDHYIIITGPPVLKEHGLRPQDVAIHAPKATPMLDQFKPLQMGLILLKLNRDATQDFHAFHGIRVEGQQVVLPNAEEMAS